MTLTIPGREVASRIRSRFPDAVIEVDDTAVVVKAESVVQVGLYLRDDPDFDCKFLNSLTSVDWLDHFDVVYHLSSMAKNHTLTLKARADRETASVPSVMSVWYGAHLQEREVFDLMGITFEGHPAMRRIFLWEGFPGHPLRKDFLTLPGGYKPGLQRFPYEFAEGDNAYPYLGRTPHADLEMGTAHLEAEAEPELAGPPPAGERPVEPTAGLAVPTGEEPGKQAARAGKEPDLDIVTDKANEDDVP